MRLGVSPTGLIRAATGGWPALWLLAALTAPGCHHETEIDFPTHSKAPTVQLVQPRPRDIVRVVGQPSFIESYERTSIYPKPTAYISKWIVDIGDKVKKVDVLAKLYAPELDEEYGTKKAAVVLDRERIALAKEMVEVARANVAAAAAQVEEAEAVLNKYEAEVVRWETEVERLKRQISRGVVNAGVLFESTNQLKSSESARDKAKATIKRTRADLVSARAALSKTEVDVRVAEAALKVAEYEEQYAKAWVDYLTLTAPFTGVISARNANTFDFVLPTTGDPTAYYLSPDISPGGAAPIYVVDRLDIVRIFVDIAERDANFVNVGTKASVLARAFRDTELPATVTRVSWALNMKSRTLRAEIDLQNPNSQLLPGMYAYVKVLIDRPNVLALPEDALVHSGDQTLVWLYDSGKAYQSEIETGVSDGQWIEVTNRRPPVPPEAPGDSVPWTPIDGGEQVILGDVSGLSDGDKVEVAATASATKTAPPAPADSPLSKSPRSPGDARLRDSSRPAKHYLHEVQSMGLVSSLALSPYSWRCRRPVCWLMASVVAALATPGCHREEPSHYTTVGKPPTVQLVKPQIRTVVRVIGQPGFTQSYERNSVYPKMNAYIKNWIVDIGDRVKKGDPLAHLFVPELVADHGTKKATVVLDKERVTLANVVVEVAQADVASAEARLEEARAELDAYQAESDRWQSETKRLDNELKRGVVNPQDVLQTTNRWKASVALRNMARATVLKARADLLSRQAALSKARVDVRVAEANLKVAESEEKKLQAWVDYLVLPAPYDGVIVARNANTFDFVLPTTGDPSAYRRAPYLAANAAAAPIYVVDRIDIIRIFVDVPEQYSDYVTIGSKATVLVKALRGRPIAGTVTRTSWALNTQSRTLRAEIDLPNEGSQLLPGMYAYAKVKIERPGVRALPLAALEHLGDKTILQVGEKSFCWVYENGRAKRIEVETGISDGEWIEVTNRRVPRFATSSAGEESWTPIDGTEQMILGNLSILADGAPVKVAAKSGEGKVAQATPR